MVNFSIISLFVGLTSDIFHNAENTGCGCAHLLALHTIAYNIFHGLQFQ